MSVWANAAGKPQLTYAERLRRATQANSSASSPSSISTPHPAPTSTASSSGATPSSSSSSTTSSATVSGAASLHPSSSPRQTLVISPLVPSSASSAASNATLSPHSGPRTLSGTTADKPSGSTTVASTGERRPSGSSRPDAGRGSLSGASSSPLSSHAVTASASVNGDDAASTTHSVNTESSSSAAPSTSTAPTSVNSPSAPASSVLSKSSSIANLPAFSLPASSGSSGTASVAAVAPTGPPVNVWEVRKQAMLEKQRQQEEVQRKAREQAQVQAKQAKEAAKAAGVSQTGGTGAESNQSATATTKNAERKQGGGNGKAQPSSTAKSSNAGSRSVSASNTATISHPKGSTSGAQQNRNAGQQGAGARGAGSTTTATHGKASRHQTSSSTVSAASTSAVSTTASKADRLAVPQSAAAAAPSSTSRDTTAQEGRRGSEVADSGKRVAGANKNVTTHDDEKKKKMEKRREEEEEGKIAASVERAENGHSSAFVEGSVGSKASTGRRTTAGDSSAVEDLQDSSRSNINSTIATSPPSQSSEAGLLGSPSARDTSSSTLNGAAMPFYSPLMDAHMGHHSHHGSVVYGHPHQHTHHHAYAADLGPVPLAPLPPPVTMSAASVAGTATPASSVSVSHVRAAPQPSTDYDNTWLERIHMLNGGQNMPVYGPLTLASTKKHAEDDVEQEEEGAKDAATRDDVGGNALSTSGSIIEDLAAVPFEKDAVSAAASGSTAPIASLQSQAQSHAGSQQQQGQSGTMLYPDTRSRARRRSSTGHKGKKAGALAALATAPGSNEKMKGDGVDLVNGGTGSSSDETGGSVSYEPNTDDTQGWQNSVDARSTKEQDRSISVRDRAANAAAQAAAMAAAVAAASSKLTAPSMNGRTMSSMSSTSGSTSGGAKVDGRGKGAAGGKKGKGQGAGTQLQHQGSVVHGQSESKPVGGAEGHQDVAQHEVKGKGVEGAAGQTPATGKRAQLSTKPLDTQITRALGGEGTGSSLSPRPAHLPATPPASLVMPPLASPSINGPVRGQSPFHSGGPQGRAGYPRMSNGTVHSGHSSYGEQIPNGGPGLTMSVNMAYNPAAAAMAASMWNGTPTSPHPYHRPHRINKDGSFSPTRAVDYAATGAGGGYYGGGIADGAYTGSGGSGYARGMGGKRGRGGRGGWRGGSSSGSGPRNREYSISSASAHHIPNVDSALVQGAAGYDPRYAGSMTPAVPQVYYVPYPVPVPYASSTSRTESNEASSVAEGGAAAGTRTTSEHASDAGGASSSRAASEGTSTPATGYTSWQQQGPGMTYPFYNGMNTNWMMSVAPSDAVRAQALGQLDFYFSPRNLEGDFFLRQRMDSNGWVPIPVVAAFKKVRQITTDVNVIRDAMLYSYNLEVDMENWRVRKRYGWEEYVLPVEQQVAALSQEQAGGAISHEEKGHTSIPEREGRPAGDVSEGGQSAVDLTATPA
ncbi:hypothetical protein A4X09_0g5118 [Tilletia walkeri]|uniref:HTH La-type RNA-binding domain-containing protein n=1 Tax=Tilletia walkeri TaxID=117179 RepID=A0A8X7N750_9BASI|nr:hypothetical protein A4X09_0g5118 [Tilletia walkeri]